MERECRIGAGRFNDRQYEGAQCCYDFIQLQPFQFVFPQEPLPLCLLLRILRKRVSETKGRLRSKRRLAAIKGCLHGLAEDVAVEAGVASQYPEIEVSPREAHEVFAIQEPSV